MSNRVHASGPLASRFALIGEAPGANEERLGQPFVGMSGRLVESWFEPAGFQRSDFRIDNVHQWRPPKGNEIKSVPKAELEASVDGLHERLAQMPNVDVIAAVGGTALEALVPGKRGITNHRGSVYDVTLRNGRPVKVIPMLHPAAIMRTAAWEGQARHDWMRFGEVARGEYPGEPEVEHFTKPTLEDVKWWRRECEAAAARGDTVLGLDIETPRKTIEVPGRLLKSGKRGKPKRVKGYPYIACVGSALTPHFGFVVPTVEWYWGSASRLELVWQELRAIGALPLDKCLQNGGFDTWWLAQAPYACRLARYRWDLKAMHHAFDPCEDHDLATLASLYTTRNFWKSEGKDADEATQWAKSWDEFMVYNSKDATAQRELWDPLYVELERDGRVEFYLKHYRAMMPALLDMSLVGIGVDEERRRTLDAEYVARVAANRERLLALVGSDLYGKATISAAKLKVYLYETLGLPPQREKKTGALTTKEVVIRRLMRRFPQKLQAAGDVILDQRRTQQLRAFVKEARVAGDGRFRSSYGFTPETGRLSATKAPDRSGGNAQNVDREVRDVYVAAPGKVLVEGDKSQIESRFVDLMCGHPETVERAYSKPWEVDVHRLNAARIFRVAPAEVTKLQRDLGKRGVHACVDAQTEVLTPEGWMRVTSLPPVIAAWDTCGRVRWSRVDRWTVGEAEEMLHFTGRALDQMVTSNHRVISERNGKLKTEMAEDVPPSARIPVCGMWDEKSREEASPALCRLLVAAQADGSFSSDRRLVFHFKKLRKADRLRWILQSAGTPFVERQKDGYFYITLAGPAVQWLYSLLGKERMFGPDLLRFDAAQMDIMVEEAHHWDGNERKRHGVRREYCNKPKENCSWLQTLAHLTGREALVRRDGRVWNTSFNKRKLARAGTPKRIVGKQTVYCPTVFESYFLVRRNDRISVTGNSNYGMAGLTFAEGLSKDGFTLTPEECDEIIAAAKHPSIEDWHRAVRMLVLKNRALTNDFGRVIRFKWDRMGDELYRRAYAFGPQSDGADDVNQNLFLPMWRWLKEERMDAQVVANVHDAVLIECWPQDAWRVARQMDVCARTEVTIVSPVTKKGYPIAVPLGYKVGPTWGGAVEFKRLPTEEEWVATMEKVMNARVAA